MKIKVTGEHICKGQQRRPTLSPVALALKEATRGSQGEVIEWRIGPGYAYHPVFPGSSTMKRMPLALDVWQRVNFYDRTGFMESFDFDIDLNTDGTEGKSSTIRWRMPLEAGLKFARRLHA